MIMNSKYQYLTQSLAALMPIGLLWIFYYPVLQAWWLADDPALLKTIVEHGILSHFYQSEVWRTLSTANLTPWVIFSLGIDWHLFGLEPSGFYWHHLLSFTLVLLIAYRVLNQFFSPLVCSLSLSVFVVSVPSANVAQFLMVRHYLEGLGFSLLAVFAYIKAVQQERWAWSYVGSFFYLLATTAKEIYVPLIIILPCLFYKIPPIPKLSQCPPSIPLKRGEATPCGSPSLWEGGRGRATWKMLMPFVVVAGSYVLWRIYMLKPSFLFSGYGESIVPKLNWEGFLALPHRLAEVLGWQYSWQLLILLLVVFVYLVSFHNVISSKMKNDNWLKMGCVLLWLMVIFLPIVPVLSILDSRYLFLPYFVLALGLAAALQFLINQNWHYVALGLGLSVLAVGIKSVESGPAIVQKPEIVKQFHKEGELVLTDNRTEGILLNPIGAEWYYRSLGWLREQVLELPAGIKACYDLCICQPSNPIYQYQSGKLITSQLSEQTRVCDRTDINLTVNLTFIEGVLNWQLGPYQQGQYYATINRQAVMDGQWTLIPSKGHFKLALPHDKIYLKIKYISPEGWDTYSSMLMLDLTQKNANGIVQLKY
jgi:hypothetical protein